ncbi:MAG: hypothetical protein HQL77_02950 [Magnetococcales bacterium]|nr:hypothetical protein [Magnetococcales bacterium]
MRMHIQQKSNQVMNDTLTFPDPWTPEHLSPLELAQVVEDCLFAYISAQSLHSREMMWPMLVEAVEALIADSRQRFTAAEPAVNGTNGLD